MSEEPTAPHQAGPRTGNALILPAYLILALFMTYPLALHFFTHIPGQSGDGYVWLWNMWWTRHALLDLHANPYYTDYLFAPYTIGLGFHSYVLINNLLSIPLQGVLPLPAINNLFIVLSIVLSGWAVYSIAKRYVRHEWAAFVGGAVYAFAPFKLTRIESHTNYAMTHWMALYILFLLRSIEDEKGRAGNALLAGIFLGCNFLTDPYYFISMLIVTAIALFAHLVRRGGASWNRAAISMALVALASAPFVLPQLYFAARDSRSGLVREVPPGTAETPYSADLLGFLSPSPHNPLLGGLSLMDRFEAVLPEGMVYAGFTALALAIGGAIAFRKKKQAVAFWSAVSVVFVILSFGPSLHVLGRPLPVPLPFRLFTYVPLLENLRAPGRFGIVAMLGVAVLSAYGLAALIPRWKFAGAVILPLILIEDVMVPFNLAELGQPPVYKEIARDDRTETVLDIPVYVRDGFNHLGTVNEITMYYQTVHEKRTLSGFTARLGPERIFLSYLNLPVIRAIVMFEMGLFPGPETLAIDKQLGIELIRLFKVGYVVIHKSEAAPLVRDYVKSSLPLIPIYEDDKIAAYRIPIEFPEDFDIDIGAEQSIPYLMRGWINGQREGGTTFAWMTGGESTLLLNLDAKSPYTLTLRLRPHDDLPDRALQLFINDAPFGRIVLGDGWDDYAVSVPLGAARDGVDRITLRPDATVPSDGPFGGAWSAATPVEYLRKMYLPNQRDDELVVLDWEQDNLKFPRGTPVSAALDRVEVRAVAR